MGFFHEPGGTDRRKPPAPPRPSAAERRRLHLQRVERLRRMQRERRRNDGDDDIEEIEDDLYEDGDEDEEPRFARRRDRERSGIRATEVMDLLHSMQRHRRQLDADHATLQQWLEQSSEFAQAWRRFNAEGGLTADDFAAFMTGRFRQRPHLRQRKHLRLIAQSIPRRRLRTLKRGPGQ